MVEFGKKIHPAKAKKGITKTATSVVGPYWSIKLVDGEYVFEMTSGGHGGGVTRQVVTKGDFADVHAGHISEYQLALKYNLS